MTIQITCSCGQPFTVPDAGPYPRLVHCHTCGRRLQVTGPGAVSLMPPNEGVQTDVAGPTARPVADRSDGCPDCSGHLASIKLFARSAVNSLSGAGIDCDVAFFAEP